MVGVKGNTLTGFTSLGSTGYHGVQLQVKLVDQSDFLMAVLHVCVGGGVGGGETQY